ncbi:MAG: methyltransferase domain-containing protein [Cyclobacteriaceae bacterium]|nr:methyltransferase domain-containing protein [Cyclobacteriaceae bacterium]
MDQKCYPDFGDKWDDRLLRKKILKFLKPDHTILDVGAGRGRILEMNFKRMATRVVGIDPDPRVKDNPLLDEGFEGLADNMPFFDNDTFDLIFCDNVLEHVEDPDRLYSEIARVLKPNGCFISKTPNKFYYVSLIAAITPESFHKFVNAKRGRNESDTFPTFYRANTAKAQRKWAHKNGLKIIEIDSIEGRPEYLRIFFITYLLGILFERIVNLLRLNRLKAILITVYRK